MSIKYIKVKRKVLGGVDAGTVKTYGAAKPTSTITLDRLCMLVSARASISGADVKAVFDSLIFAVEYELINGNAIQLGELGALRTVLNTEGTVDEKEFKSHKIKKAKIVFKPGASLLNAMANAKYEPYEVKEVTVEEECEKPHAI